MKELFSKSVEKHEVMYINYIGDGDFKTYDCSALPKTVLDPFKPIYQDLSNDKFLEHCVDRYTQNSNESFNQLIWKIAPKMMHS